MTTKNLATVLFVLMMFFSCKSSSEIVEVTMESEVTQAEAIIGKEALIFSKRRGFRYQVPKNMQESPDYANSFRYDNLLLEKGADYQSSSVVIAIRHYDISRNRDLHEFAKFDQSLLRQSYRPLYKRGWKPTTLSDKSIEYTSYEFSYKIKKDNIYQRSVYLKNDNRIHVISLSSLEEARLSMRDSEEFWSSIRID